MIGPFLDRHRYRKRVRIGVEELGTLLTPGMERSMYLHPNAIAREIFWQRLDEVYRRVRSLPAECTSHCLDLGGGTGVLARSVAEHFERYTIIDLEAEDAERVIEHFGTPNVEIQNEDVLKHHPAEPYSTIIAADVLEHFQDLGAICRKVDSLLMDGGRLIVSLPTENQIYRLGRIILRKSKPADHYHDSRTVIKALGGQGLEVEVKSWIPSMVASLPLFDVAVLRKP